MAQDIIYIGGGNTKYMLKIWNDNNFISAFIDAYNSGIILSGISAGAVCWLIGFYQTLLDQALIHEV